MRDNSVRVRGWRRMAQDEVWRCWAMLSEIKWREVIFSVVVRARIVVRWERG